MPIPKKAFNAPSQALENNSEKGQIEEEDLEDEGFIFDDEQHSEEAPLVGSDDFYIGDEIEEDDPYALDALPETEPESTEEQEPPEMKASKEDWDLEDSSETDADEETVDEDKEEDFSFGLDSDDSEDLKDNSQNDSTDEKDFKEKLTVFLSSISNSAFARQAGRGVDFAAKPGLNLLEKAPKGEKLSALSRKNLTVSRIIGVSIPILIFLMVITVLRFFMYPEAVTSATLEFPDDGKVSSQFVLEKNEVSVVIKNEGPIIAEATPSATVSSTRILNPISWVRGSGEVECKAPLQTIDIDQTKKVTLKCSEELKGFRGIVKGKID